MYSRQAIGSLPNNNSDLLTLYTEVEEANISKEDTSYVGQAGTSAYLIHQFKNFVNTTKCDIDWIGKTTLLLTSSTVYLQIYNQVSHAWETIDTDNKSTVNYDFELKARIGNLTNYKDADQLITVRVYQLADSSARTLSTNFYQVLLPLSFINKYVLQGNSFINKYVNQGSNWVSKYFPGTFQDQT